MTPTAFILLLFVAAVFCALPIMPKFPSKGVFTMSSRYASETVPFSVVRVYSDGDAGYLRWDELSNDGMLQEISLWDYNANTVHYLGTSTCYWEEGVFPTPYDFTNWVFKGYSLQGDYFAEAWESPDNLNLLYVDAFTRLPRQNVQLGNTTDGDDNIIVDFNWDLSIDSTEVFLLPRLLRDTCVAINTTTEFMGRAHSFNPYTSFLKIPIVCGICKGAAKVLVGKSCPASRVACLATGPLAPFCGIILPIVCKAGCALANCPQIVCKAIRAC